MAQALEVIDGKFSQRDGSDRLRRGMKARYANGAARTAEGT